MNDVLPQKLLDAKLSQIKRTTIANTIAVTATATTIDVIIISNRCLFLFSISLLFTTKFIMFKLYNSQHSMSIYNLPLRIDPQGLCNV